MNFNDAAQGFLFLTVVLGIGGFMLSIATSIAISDGQDYVSFMVVLNIIVAVTFLASGFMAFSL